jgi:DNA-3-methyladenine glycosylase
VSGSKTAPLSRAFFARAAEEVAPDLLGCLLISTVDGKRAVGRIVETEAYIGPHDPASHAWEQIGRTRRNATMFGRPGHAYIYRSYGLHWCLNIVTNETGYPAAVLIRAIEPVAGVAVMRARRWGAAGAGPDTNLGSGPGKLASALGITGELDGHPLHRPPLVVASGERVDTADIVTGPRIGISRAADWPLRFSVRASRHVSR